MKSALRLLATFALVSCLHDVAFAASAPENFIYTSSGDLDAARSLLSRPDIGGAQIVYNWRQLETARASMISLRSRPTLQRSMA